MEKLPTITIDAIKAKVGQKNFEKGETYFLTKAIANVDIQNPLHITGTCMGTAPKPYKWSISFDEKGIKSAFCSCPVGSDTPACKHIAAALLYYHSIRTTKTPDKIFSPTKLPPVITRNGVDSPSPKKSPSNNVKADLSQKFAAYGFASPSSKSNGTSVNSTLDEESFDETAKRFAIMMTWQKVAYSSIIHKLRNEIISLNNVILDKESEIEALYQNIDKLTEKNSILTEETSYKTSKMTKLQKELSLLVNLSRGFKDKVEYMHSLCFDENTSGTASLGENAFSNTSSYSLTRQVSLYNENTSKELYNIMENSQKDFSDKRKEVDVVKVEEKEDHTSEPDSQIIEKKRKISADLGSIQEAVVSTNVTLPTTQDPPALENLIEEYISPVKRELTKEKTVYTFEKLFFK